MNHYKRKGQNRHDDSPDYEYHSVSSIKANSVRSSNSGFFRSEKGHYQQFMKNSFQHEQMGSLRKYKTYIGKYITIWLQFITITQKDTIQNWKLCIFKDTDNLQIECFIGNQVIYENLKEDHFYELKNATLEYFDDGKKIYKINIKDRGIIKELNSDQQNQLFNQQKEQESQNFSSQNGPQSETPQKFSKQFEAFYQRFPMSITPSGTKPEICLYNILVVICEILEDQEVIIKNNRNCKISKIIVIDQENVKFEIVSWNKFSNINLQVNQLVFFEKLELKYYLGKQYMQVVGNISKIITDEDQLILLPNYDNVFELAAERKRRDQNQQQKNQALLQKLNNEETYSERKMGIINFMNEMSKKYHN